MAKIATVPMKSIISFFSMQMEEVTAVKTYYISKNRTASHPRRLYYSSVFMFYTPGKSPSKMVSECFFSHALVCHNI